MLDRSLLGSASAYPAYPESLDAVWGLKQRWSAERTRLAFMHREGLLHLNPWLHVKSRHQYSQESGITDRLTTAYERGAGSFRPGQCSFYVTTSM